MPEATVTATPPATPATPKVDLSKLPTYGVTRNNVTLKLEPHLYGKRGDRQGQIFYSLEEITPENENTVKEFFGNEWWLKKENTLVRSTCQMLDTIFTDKGKEPLNIEDVIEALQKLSTRGEPVGVQKEMVNLITQWFEEFTNNPEISEQVIIDTFKKVNDAACERHEATKDEDDDSDPVLLEEGLRDQLIASLHDEVQTAKANPEYAGLPANIVRQLAQGKINRRVFTELGTVVKGIKAEIVKNTKTRRKKGEKDNGNEEVAEVAATETAVK